LPLHFSKIEKRESLSINTFFNSKASSTISRYAGLEITGGSGRWINSFMTTLTKNIASRAKINLFNIFFQGFKQICNYLPNLEIFFKFGHLYDQ